MKKIKWTAYNDLAWTDTLLNSPEACAAETQRFCRLIREYAKNDPKTLLHLGCGAGMNDYTFKKYFSVTGVDISKGMLKIAKALNPEISYLRDDMRTVRLPERFDAMAIPDAIGYMTTQKDLVKTIRTAYDHLNPDGVLLIITHTKEEFRENNFVYTGEDETTRLTVFENNSFTDERKDTYEAVITYLIRRNGKLKIVNDCHIIGLFGRMIWLKRLSDAGFEVETQPINNLYDENLMGEGEYRQTIFICKKTSK